MLSSCSLPSTVILAIPATLAILAFVTGSRLLLPLNPGSPPPLGEHILQGWLPKFVVGGILLPLCSKRCPVIIYRLSQVLIGSSQLARSQSLL